MRGTGSLAPRAPRPASRIGPGLVPRRGSCSRAGARAPADDRGAQDITLDRSASLHGALDPAPGSAETRDRIVLKELRHRVRNGTATVRSIARRSVTGQRSVENYVECLDGRIAAYARVQSAAIRDPLAGIDLELLLRDALSVLAAPDRQVSIGGPSGEPARPGRRTACHRLSRTFHQCPDTWGIAQRGRPRRAVLALGGMAGGRHAGSALGRDRRRAAEPRGPARLRHGFPDRSAPLYAQGPGRTGEGFFGGKLGDRGAGPARPRTRRRLARGSGREDAIRRARRGHEAGPTMPSDEVRPPVPEGLVLWQGGAPGSGRERW